MEAPEKIYLRKRNKLPLEVVRDKWYEIDPQNIYGSVEYISKDVFIENAVRYLNSKLYDWVRIEHSNPSVSPNVIIKQDFIEDFKTYMKGE